MDNKNEQLDKNLWKAISFMIFRTGSILIVGNCDIFVLKIIYNFLKNILQTEYNNICIKHEIEKKEKIKRQKKKTRIITFIKNTN